MAANRPPTPAAALRALAGGGVICSSVGGAAACPDGSIAPPRLRWSLRAPGENGAPKVPGRQ